VSVEILSPELMPVSALRQLRSVRVSLKLTSNPVSPKTRSADFQVDAIL